MRKSYVIWLIVFFALVLAAIVASGGNVLWYLSIPAAVMILGPALTLSLASFGFGEIVAAFRAAFDDASDRTDLDHALLFFEGRRRFEALTPAVTLLTRSRGHACTRSRMAG